ncbi:MAG: VOC family protein [Labilithrix sp.]|nr:VOC family protein [Labilithrix sp.]MBX3220506.1 VOC family protein [Labilithrix sp.]
MTTHTTYKQGTFSWIELTTTDAAKAKAFYGELFGWTFEDMPAGPGMTYTMAKLGEHHVAGLFQMGAEMAAAVPPNWSSYVTVDDVDGAASKVTANGGKVLKEPFDVLDAGRMAVFQDPAGAAFCVWKANKHIGAGVQREPGALCWNEVFTTDVDAAGKFYASVFGWNTEAVDMGPMGVYTLFKRPGETENAGGMMPMPPNMKGVPPHWLAHIHVASCDASTKKASDLGAKTLMPPVDIPNIGRFSIVQDPTGAALALFQNAH